MATVSQELLGRLSALLCRKALPHWCRKSCVHRKQKSRRGVTPEGVQPRRLTLQRTPWQGRVVLRLVIRRLLIVGYGTGNAIPDGLAEGVAFFVGEAERFSRPLPLRELRIPPTPTRFWRRWSALVLALLPAAVAQESGGSAVVRRCCLQSTSVRMARQIGAGSIGHAMPIRARSARRFASRSLSAGTGSPCSCGAPNRTPDSATCKPACGTSLPMRPGCRTQVSST